MRYETKNKARYFSSISLLESFSKEELKRFARFITSSYFNTDQRVIQLFEILRTKVLHKKAFDELTQIAVYQEVFLGTIQPKKIFKEKEKKFLRAKMSLLTKLLQRFLVVEGIEENLANEYEILARKLLEKQQYLLLNRLNKKYQIQQLRQQERGMEYYTFSLQLEIGKMNYLHQKGRLLKEDNFSQLTQNLDLYYLLNKLKIHSTIRSILNVSSNKKFDFSSIKAITSLLELPTYAQHPLIIIYQTVIHLMETKESETFYRLLDLLQQQRSFIPKKQLSDFYLVACNFCVHKVRVGEIDYKNKLFELYQNMDKYDLLLDEELIDIGQLKNIVSLASQLGAFDWAIEIINKYYPLVEKTIQKSVYHFNRGVVAFYQWNYQEAISHFIRVEKVNLAYDINVRVLLLKTHYEMDEEYDERTMQIFRSVERYVQNHQFMSLAYKKSYKNFIQILINLYRVHHGVGKRTVEHIQRKMEKMDFISDKKWLLEKIAHV